jgi:opacity protein-like surface antigen
MSHNKISKLALLFILSLFFNYSAYANPYQWLGVGVSGGIEQSIVQQNIYYQINSNPTDLDFNFQADQTDIDPTAAVHLTYGTKLKRFYLGLDLSASLVTNKNRIPTFDEYHYSSQSDLFASSVKLHNIATLTFNPGYFITPTTMLYANLGLVDAKVNLDAQLNNIHYGSSKTELFPQFGFGIAHQVANKWWLKFNYFYTDYKSLKAYATQQGQDGSQTINVRADNDLRLQTNSFNIGLYYYPFAKGDKLINNNFMQSDAFNGLYFGLSGDLTQHNLRQQIDLFGTANTQLFNANKSAAMFNCGLQLGYGQSFLNHYYLGLVASKQLLNSVIISDPLDSSGIAPSGGDFVGKLHSKITTVNYLNLALKPGVIMHKTILLYALLGLNISEQHFSGRMIRNEGSALNDVYYTKNEATLNPEVGLGLEKKFGENFSLGINYLATFYHRQDIRKEFVDVKPSSSRNKTITNNPCIYTNTISLNLNYYFS